MTTRRRWFWRAPMRLFLGETWRYCGQNGNVAKVKSSPAGYFFSSGSFCPCSRLLSGLSDACRTVVRVDVARDPKPDPHTRPFILIVLYLAYFSCTARLRPDARIFRPLGYERVQLPQSGICTLSYPRDGLALTGTAYLHLSKHETLIQCWVNVRPASKTLSQL